FVLFQVPLEYHETSLFSVIVVLVRQESSNLLIPMVLIIFHILNLLIQSLCAIPWYSLRKVSAFP
ncbi:MAG: hypothetical protein ACFFAI_16740, partial [Promethearchaeota archaeon]